MLAVLGVTISVGPCLYQIFGPCLTRFFKKLGRVIKKVLTWIFKKIVIPLVTFLHNWGFIELGIYMLTFQLVFEGSKMDITEQLGFMITLFGLFFTVLAMFYSMILHVSKLRVKVDNNLAANLILVWIILFTIPVAIKLQSTFMGYITFMCLFTILGFRMVFFGLGIGIGWDEDETMERSASATAVILALYTGIRFSEAQDKYLDPFRSAICVLGGNILFLALLIMSSRYYCYDEYYTLTQPQKVKRYVLIQLLTFTVYCMGIGFGAVYAMDGLRNTAIVYMILWVIEKYHEIYFKITSNIWFFIFTISSLVCWAALEINKHPEFVVDMFKAVDY